MVRDTRVAVATARISGTMKERTRPVSSSIISTTAEIGPCVVAASTAPADQRDLPDAGDRPRRQQHQLAPDTINFRPISTVIE
jgi:hypothetical protein